MLKRKLRGQGVVRGPWQEERQAKGLQVRWDVGITQLRDRGPRRQKTRLEGQPHCTPLLGSLCAGTPGRQGCRDVWETGVQGHLGDRGPAWLQ